MPSPASRRVFEILLRTAAFAGLAWLIVAAFTPRRPAGRASLATTVGTPALREWSFDPPADSLSVNLRAAPDPVVLDWLVALRRAGTHVTWSGDGLTKLGLEVEPRRDPAGGVLVRAGGEADRTIALRDNLGPLDSLHLGPVGGTAMVPAAWGLVAGSPNANQSVTALATPSDSLRRILVLCAAGWESKFVVVALAERGWVVDARFAVAPRMTVSVGQPTVLDTGNYAAVIALDTNAIIDANALTRYVHSGGGLILGPDAVGLRAFRDLLPAGPGRIVSHSGLTVERVTTRADLPIRDLAPLALNAVPLEQVNGHLVAAARRVGNGRVLALGLGETWRWRMQGDESAAGMHRAWWAANVASVAYGSVSRPEETANPAPLASLYQALGPPTTLATEPGRGGSRTSVILLLVMAALLGEWASRRLRGAA